VGPRRPHDRALPHHHDIPDNIPGLGPEPQDQRTRGTWHQADDTAAIARALNDFEHRYNEIAEPFDWNFTRADLAALMDRLDAGDMTTAIPLAA